jgi:ribosomal peptide maturation radical SAM protein 1
MQKAPQKKKKDVILIHMPVSDLHLPSIGLGLLKSALAPLGLSVKILYFNFQFAKLIGMGPYLQTSEQSTRYNQVGEWIFSGALFERSERDVEGYIGKILRRPSEPYRRFLSPVSRKFIQTVLKARGKVGRFLNECLQEVLGYQPRVVGFSSTFQQQAASLALAMLIKKHSPTTFIVFGGPNCEEIMGVEMVRQFPFIDAVVSGEGDIIFPQLVQRIVEDKPLTDLTGVYTRTGLPASDKDGHYPNAPSVQDMDALPYPDFDDFFDQLGKSHVCLPAPLPIPIQASRGCWWGERMRCTFCGLNGATMKYRSKSSQRVLQELTSLLEKYHADKIQIVDNILNHHFFKDLLPELAAKQLGVEFFCEVKSNLSKEQVRLLRDANFRTIQPGIESLNNHVLKLMRKGVSLLQNVQLLKWCKEFGIVPVWSLLCGVPDESSEEYERMAKLIPLLTHFPPAQGFGAFRLDRFSSNFEYAEQIGLKDVAPSPAYYHIYPFEPEAVANLAYYFTYQYRSGQNVEEYTRNVLMEWTAWKKHYDSSDLFFVDQGKKLFIWDQRPMATEPLTVLSGLRRDLYIACDSAQSISHLRKIAESYTGKTCSEEEVEKLVEPVMSKHLMMRDGDCYISLAIPVGDYVPKREEFERFQGYLHEMEVKNQNEALMKKVKIKEVSKDFRVSKEEIACASGYARSIGNQSICS